MKNYSLLFVAIASLFSIGCLAQSADHILADSKMQLMSNEMSNNDLAVVSYHVEERINMPFGSSITTYEVSNISLVRTNELGENNTRVVTPKYGKAKTVPMSAATSASIVAPKMPIVAVPALSPTKVVAAPKRIAPEYVNVDILSTYERVLEKGYRSIDMLKRVANNRYFENDLVVAAKWYKELFAMSSDQEAVMYFRYAQSLKAINENEKAAEMMAIFEQKNK